MAQKEESIPFLAMLVKDIAIKDDVKYVLGPRFHGSHTWGDVHNQMQEVSTILRDDIIDYVQQKLRDEVKIRKDAEEVARAAQYDLILILHQIIADSYVRRQSHMTKSNSLEATGFNDQTQAAREEAGVDSKEEEVETAAQYDLVLRLHQITADLDARRQAGMTKNNSNDKEPNDFHFAIAKVLAGVKPHDVELIVPLIVEMMAQYNVRMTAKTTAKIEEGDEAVQIGAFQISSDMENDKGKGKVTEGQELKAKAKTNASVAPLRDYRDAYGKDHGFAMRQQLNAHPDPSADI